MGDFAGSSSPASSVPFGLLQAKADLVALLELGIERSSWCDILDTEFSKKEPAKPHGIGDDLPRCVERFIDELKAIEGALEELKRRAFLVERLCDEGSEYERARFEAIESYPGTPLRKICSSRWAIVRLKMNPTLNPTYLGVVEQQRQDIETVLFERFAIWFERCPLKFPYRRIYARTADGLRLSCGSSPKDSAKRHPALTLHGVAGLTDRARRAFESWRDCCRSVEKSANMLEVDGCRYLYHVYHAGEPTSGDDDRFVRDFVKHGEMGGVTLDDMRTAAIAMVAWLALCGTWEDTATPGRGQSNTHATNPSHSNRVVLANEERDKWLYEQCCELVAYETIRIRLAAKSQCKKGKWESLASTNGIKGAAIRYAKRHKLPPIPQRQNGRPKPKQPRRR